MRTPEELLPRIRKRLDERWAATVWAQEAAQPDGDAASGTAPSWPHSLPLGTPSSAELAADFGAHVRAVHAWRDWARDNDVDLVEKSRRVAGTAHQLPTHVVVRDIESAARIAGGTWPGRIDLARTRARIISEAFPQTTNPVRALRACVRLTDVDFGIAGRVAGWFASRPHPVAALTPRQVPIEGVHAKWLGKHHDLVRNLVGLDDLNLAPGHPPRIHFTYLDPDHLSVGRKHDSFSVGDRFDLPYEPRVVIISENKDTAVGFPPVPGGIAVEGSGSGGGTIAATPWIRDAPLVIYWGDMDVEGLSILHEFRTSGVPATSMLMDLATYEAYARFGTNTDKREEPIKPASPRPDRLLCGGELELYEHLTSGEAPVLRVEQERIPLAVAAEQVACLVATSCRRVGCGREELHHETSKAAASPRS